MMTFFNRYVAGAIVALGSILFGQTASAAVYTWDASGAGTTFDGSGAWSTSSAYWWSGSSDSAWTTSGTDSAVFGAAAGSNPYTVTLGSSVAMAGVTFANQNYTIAPDAGGLYGLTIGSGGVTAGASATIAAPVALGAAQTWTVAAGQALNVGGPISGSFGLTTAGAGTLNLSGADTYSGATVVSGGTLNLAAGGTLNGISCNEVAGGVLAISGTLTVANGGMFAIATGYSSATSGTVAMNGGVLNIGNGGGCAYIGGKVNNTGTAGLGVFNINGGTVNVAAAGSNPNGYGDATAFWLNPYANGGASTINLNGGMLSSAGPISDGGSSASVFNFSGGTLQAAFNSTAFLTTTTNHVNAGGAVIDTQGFAITISKTLVHGTGSPDGGLTKVGNGTLTLSTNASTFTGNVAINQGTVVLNTGNLGLNAATSARAIRKSAAARLRWPPAPRSSFRRTTCLAMRPVIRWCR